MKTKLLVTCVWVLTGALPLWSQALDPVPSKLTHLMYTPTPFVNSQNSLVLGLHEISYSLDGKLQLQLSLLGSIGHVDLGAKYQLTSGIAIGGGLADWWGHSHSLDIHYSNDHRVIYHHHYHGKRVGVFLTGEMSGGGFNSAYTLHAQLGRNISGGLDLGGIKKMGNIWSLMLEAGSSLDALDATVYLSGTAGIRITPPAAPFLFIDLGITPLTVSVGNHNGLGGASLYLDVSGAFDLN